MLELPDDKVRADDAARVRDYLFSHGPSLPQRVASDCDVSISFVLRLIRQGTLMELRPQEPGTCEVCDAQNIVGTLCPACRQKLTPPAGDDVPLPRPAPRAEPASGDASRPGFHSRRPA